MVEKVSNDGETGYAYWQTMQFQGLRIRLVEYTAGYFADHWCRKGHIIYCLKGAFESELESGDSFMLNEGMIYVVSDDLSSHHSISKDGCTLLIVDGVFLQSSFAL